jgi:mannose-6-phosphate isomerase
MSQTIPPLCFVPTFRSALWGGRRLAGMFSNAPADGPISEAWVLGDVGNEPSVVADGPWEGATLRELMASHRLPLLGPALIHHDVFPLLFKFIDAREPLSVQVHPNDEQAQRLSNEPRGKTEAWIIRHAEPGARVFAGLLDGIGQTELRKSLNAQSIADCLSSFEPHVDDCIFLPAGTVHAAGGGVVVFEVQQASDLTYRLFDWNRIDSTTGRPRELHIDRALQCIDFKNGPVFAIEPHSSSVVQPLVRCPYFELRRITISGPMRFVFESAYVLTGLAGSGDLVRLVDEESTALPIHFPVLVPPGQYLVQPSPEFSWIECRLL